MNERLASAHLGKRSRRVMQRHAAKAVPFYQPQHSKLGVTNSCRVLQDDIEDRLQVGRRTRNNAQHFGSRSLLLQRLIALVCQQRNLLVFVPNGRTATTRDLRRIGALCLCRWGSPFSWRRPSLRTYHARLSNEGATENTEKPPPLHAHPKFRRRHPIGSGEHIDRGRNRHGEHCRWAWRMSAVGQ